MLFKPLIYKILAIRYNFLYFNKTTMVNMFVFFFTLIEQLTIPTFRILKKQFKICFLYFDKTIDNIVFIFP